MLKFLLLLVFSFNLFSSDEKELRKIHFQNVELKPRNTFLESQITKIFIRDISRLLEREVIVGKDLNYRKYSIQIESLKVDAVNKKGLYDVVVSYRNETNGKLINQKRLKKIRQAVLLQNIERISKEIFLKAKLEKDQITYVGDGKSKVSIKTKLKNIKNQSKKTSVEQDSNVRVKDEVIQKEISEDIAKGNKLRIKNKKIKNWEDRLKKGKNITVYLPDPPPEEKIPFFKEQPDPPAKPAPPVVAEAPKPKPAPPRPVKRKKKRRKFNLNFESDFIYSQVTSDDLFSDVKGDIPYFGLKTDFILVLKNERFNDRWFVGYRFPLESINYRQQNAKLSGELRFGAGLEVRPFKKWLNIGAFFVNNSYSFVSAKTPNTTQGATGFGLVGGQITSSAIMLRASVDFNFGPKLWNELGYEFYNNLSATQDYDSTREKVDFSEYRAFYSIGNKTKGYFKLFYQNLRFTGEPNPVNQNNFKYDSNRFGVSYNFASKI